MNKTATKPIRIMLVDDSALVRSGIRTVLNAHGADVPTTVIGEAATAEAAVSGARQLKPDVVLLDIRLPDGSGLEACRQILKERPETQVLVLTSFSNDNLVYEAVIAGAKGYLMKEVDPAGLMDAIANAAAGRSVLTPDVTARVLRLLRSGETAEGVDLGVLSPQERRVLALVAEGRTNKEIGDQMNLSENTVKNYLVSVFEKLKVKRRSQAAAMYVQKTGAAKE
jgi:DNA-binding NarL/FixJ family response regulator